MATLRSRSSLSRQDSSNSSSNGSSALRRQPSTDISSSVSYETDEEFERALSSYDIPAVSDALRRYLAFEVQSSLSSASSKQQSAQVKGKFYERFNQILDRIFGNDDISKHKYGGWLDYSMGVAIAGAPTTLKKKKSNLGLMRTDIDTYLETLSTNGRAVLKLLGSGKDDDGSIFQFLFRMPHPVEFKLDLDMLTEQSKMSIMSRSAFTSVLFTQLLHKPLAKQFLDLRNPVLLVTIKELYLFCFLRHPASATHQTTPGGSESSAKDAFAAAKRPSSLMGSISESFGKPKGKTDYSWRNFFNDGLLSLTKGNPYNVLLLQYLRAFFPDTSKIAAESRFHAKVLHQSNLFLHILIEFWLRQNLIVFSEEPEGQADTNVNNLARATPKLASPFANVHTYTSYMAPSDDLLCSLLLTLIHLLSDSFFPAAIAEPVVPSPAKSGYYSSPDLMVGSGGVYLTPSVTVIRRPLYEFFRLVFSRAPIGLSPTAFLAITDVWLAYIQPWKCKAWGEAHVKRSTLDGNNGSTAAAANTSEYTSAWESYVLANYHFYTVLLGVFVERAKELDFTGSDERNLSVLDRVLSVYNSDLLVLLRKASEYLEKSQPFAMPYNLGNVRTKPKAIDPRDGLTPIQGQILTFYCKSLGVECTPVPLHGSFHRDAERLFDKLWTDAGISGMENSSPGSKSASSTSSPLSAVFRSGAADPAEKYLERVQRLSRNLRRVFEISDAYVSSTNHSRSLAGASSAGGPESFAPSRDSKLPHLLSSLGVFQLTHGLRLCSPDSISYLGDPMLRPICSYEIPFLVRLSYRVSTWLNEQLGLENPYHGRHFDDNIEVDPSSAYSRFRFNFRCLASKVNLAYLSGFLLLFYVLHLW